MRPLFLTLLASCFVGTLGFADATPPPGIDRASYNQWLTSIGSPVSPYFDYVFGWFEAQQTQDLPAQVANDPDHLFVTVDAPLEEAKKVESSGDISEGTTYGLETYGILDAPIDIVLETILFRWGKPVGQASGVTHPKDSVYGYREETLTEEWGVNSYKTFTKRAHGGIANDENDSFTLLVRGDATKGYALVGSFLAATGDTSTTSYITIVLIKPTADGKTDYRVVGMQSGQSYTIFGLDSGRRNYGFNVKRIREGQKDFFGMVNSLKDTGSIPEKR